MVLHIPGALQVGHVVLALELGENIRGRFAQQIHQHIEPAAMGHADDHFFHAGDTSLLLSRWVRELQEFSLEEAVRLLTFDQASVLGLRRRGLVRPGYAADLVVFDPDAIDYLPAKRVTDLPGGGSRLFRDAIGIAEVIVNGSVAVDHGVITGDCGGQVLRGGELC